MGLGLKNFFKKIFYEKLSNGDDFFYVDVFNEDEDSKYSSNLKLALNHPILTPAILFKAKILSQARFYIINKDTKEKIYDHNILDVLNNPNVYQSSSDLLTNIVFTKVANGTAVIYAKKGIGSDDIDSFFVLDYSKIEWPKDYKNKFYFKSKKDKAYKGKIVYDKKGLNLDIDISNLIFINELPNGLKSNNFFDTYSIVDGLKEVLKTTNDSIAAKSIVLKTNGRDLISNNNSDFPLSSKERKNIQNKLNKKYGLGKGRIRTIVTDKNLTWKSMHIALRDLGLDESTKVDSNIIYTALHIPKDILSLQAKKTTYNNFKESMVSFVQNQIHSEISDICKTIAQHINLDKNLEIVGDFDHLPIMKFILIEKYKGIKLMGEALQSLLKAGVKEKDALELCGLPKNLKLKKNN